MSLTNRETHMSRGNPPPQKKSRVPPNLKISKFWRGAFPPKWNMNIIININWYVVRHITLSVKMCNYLEVQLVNHFYPLTWILVSVGNDVWVCDHRRGESPPSKKNMKFLGGGSSHPSPKT